MQNRLERSRPDWRLPDGDGYYAKHDIVDFAQEFLTRNADYRREYAKAQSGIAGSGSTKDMEVLARRWGLTFPFRP